MSSERLENAKTALAGKEFFDSYFKAHSLFATGCCITMMIKRKALKDAGLFLPGQPRINDVDMWLRIAYRWPPIGFIPAPLAIYHLDVPNSIIKTYKDPAVICDFIDRHLELAQNHGMLEEFKPCAAKIMGWWIHCYILERQGKPVRQILKQYGHLYPRYYRATTYIKSIFPRTGIFYENLKAKITS